MNNWWILIIVLAAMFAVSTIIYIIRAIKNDDILFFHVVPIVIGIILLSVVMYVIPALLCAKRDYNRQKQRYEYVMQVIETMDGYDYSNIGITEKVLEYNEWLEDAKANKETFGRWSVYYDIPVEEMEYIGVDE